MNKLKRRWNVSSNWQLTVIFVVFAITGSTAAKFAGPLTEFIGISKNDGWHLYWPIRILAIFPIYQILLVSFGWVFGEFLFFWKFEKKILRFMKFLPSNKN